jgi:hypothetical protein
VVQEPGFWQSVATVQAELIFAGRPAVHFPTASAHWALAPLAVHAAPTLPVVQAPVFWQSVASVHAALFFAGSPALHFPLTVQNAAVAHVLPNCEPAFVQVSSLALQSPTTRQGPLATPPVVW